MKKAAAIMMEKLFKAEKRFGVTLGRGAAKYEKVKPRPKK